MYLYDGFTIISKKPVILPLLQTIYPVKSASEVTDIAGVAMPSEASLVQLVLAPVNRNPWRQQNRFRWLRFLCPVLLLCSLEVFAAELELAPGLLIAVPENLNLTSLPSDRLGGRTLIQGELGGKPGYFGAGLMIRKLESNSALWKRLEAKLNDRSRQRDLRLTRQGQFTTEEAVPVYYRLYEYSDGKRRHRQLYFLIRNQQRAYWVYWVTVPSVDINTVLPLAELLMTRARISY